MKLSLVLVQNFNGFAKMWMKIFTNHDVRVKVARNSHGQPIGSEARLLAGYLGIIAQNVDLLRINYESWHHMPDSNKNQALNNIKERFTLEVLEEGIRKKIERP
ncbi:myf6 [Gossypium arboreum]|uniref:Myf6 n=1 Tax=Gossypium arboreum TaxID=29729 RepID=A0A0B0PB79_GOSAR|nr:myf6 [Gossypium arboreum]